jgi:chromosome segregation ATPase
MRKYLYFGWAAAGLLLVPARGFACQQDQSQQSQRPSSQQGSDSQAKPSAQTSQLAPAQPDPLVAAARRAREEKKDQAKPARVFTNDNLPTTGGISAVGETATASAGENKAGASDAPASLESQEKTWREKFAKLRHKLEQDQQELDVMQRELGVLDVQYYSNPVKAMQQDLTRSDINKKTGDIDAKKALIEADKQAISDAEDDLRKAGGDSGWSR